MIDLNVAASVGIVSLIGVAGLWSFGLPGAAAGLLLGIGVIVAGAKLLY
jgi:hypothetical protein